MRRLRLIIAAATLTVTLFLGSGVAFAGVEWCDWGSPPSMDSGIAPNPNRNPHGMPTPEFKSNGNAEFTENPAVDGALLPPGMAKSSQYSPSAQ